MLLWLNCKAKNEPVQACLSEKDTSVSFERTLGLPDQGRIKNFNILWNARQNEVIGTEDESQRGVRRKV